MTSPDIRHPLTAIRRMGQVVGVGNTPNSVTVNIGADTTNVELPYLASYTPTINDVVLILSITGDNVVIGALASWTNTDGTTGHASVQYFESVRPTNTGITTGTQLSGLVNRRLRNDYNPGQSQWNYTTGVWTCPSNGLYLWDTSIKLTASISPTWYFVQFWLTGPGVGAVDTQLRSNENSGNGTVAINTMSGVMLHYQTTGDKIHVNLFQNDTVHPNISNEIQTYITVTKLAGSTTVGPG